MLSSLQAEEFDIQHDYITKTLKNSWSKTDVNTCLLIFGGRVSYIGTEPEVRMVEHQNVSYMKDEYLSQFLKSSEPALYDNWSRRIRNSTFENVKTQEKISCFWLFFFTIVAYLITNNPLIWYVSIKYVHVII